MKQKFKVTADTIAEIDVDEITAKEIKSLKSQLQTRQAKIKKLESEKEKLKQELQETKWELNRLYKYRNILVDLNGALCDIQDQETKKVYY